MKTRLILCAVLSILMLGSCVSLRKYKAQTDKLESLTSSFSKSQADLNACNNARENARIKSQADQDAFNKQIEDLNKQIEMYKLNNNQVLNQLQTMSVISNSQAESIKKSMENIGMKDAYIQGLQKSLAQKDSLNMALVMNLKGVIGDLNDKDINIKVDKGVVYIDISDKMLFESGRYVITKQAKDVLGKVAKVLKNQPNLEFMVEGHTDNVPFKQGVLLDNWDLSVKRATAVVRLLQDQYGLDPAIMTAAGRSEYKPLTTNETIEGKAANRRTRIVILPQLDQFFKLLEKK
jgi:chemotaxis protein MotB